MMDSNKKETDAVSVHEKAPLQVANVSAKDEEHECAVCLQTCIHPVKLPCSHIFCFLCVKGVANQSKRCAMCRQEIPTDFLDNPTLLKKVEEEAKGETEEYQWFYGGRNGWWKYDERTNKDLEEAYKSKAPAITLLLGGYNYVMHFDSMVQYRQNDPTKKRRIKRDKATAHAKGTAGLSRQALSAANDGETSSPKVVPQKKGKKRKNRS